MSDSVDILKKLALQVRNASTEGENTAERIGRIFIGILENMDNSDIEKLTKYFLRKDKEDSTNFLLSLLGGVLIKNYAKFGDFVTGVSGGYIGEDARAELEALVLRSSLSVPELRFNRQTYFEGYNTISPGGGLKIKSFVANSDGSYTVIPDLEDGVPLGQKPDDILLGFWHDKSVTTGDFIGFRKIQYRITSADYDEKTFVMVPRPGYEFVPHNEMRLGQTGNFTDKERQTYIIIDVRDGNCCITLVDNANTWDPEPAQMKSWFGKKKGMTINGINCDRFSAVLQDIIMTGLIFQIDEITGSTVRVPIDFPSWEPGRKYAYYSRVPHNGSTWLCVNDKGTTSEPSENNPDWLVSAAKGDKGDPGLSVIGGGHWESSKTPYEVNTMVTLAGCVFISKVKTSNPPIKIAKFRNGRLRRKRDGGYILAGRSANRTVHADWQEMVAPVGPSASYWLDSPVSVINFTSTGTPSPSGFLVTCKQNVAGNVSTCSTLYLAARKYNGSWLAHVGATLNSQISVPATAGYTQFAVRAYKSASDANAWNNNFVAEKGVGVANDGAIGATGATGAFPRDRGVFASGQTYVWNADYRDKVIYLIGGVYYNFLVKNYGASVTDAPTSVNGDSNWEAMQKFVNIATDTLFADGANVAGFMFKDKVLKSFNDKGETLLINGETGYFKCKLAEITGTITADKGRIGPFSIISGVLSSKILYENETNKYVGFNLSAGQIEFYNERTFANVRIGGNTQFVTIEGIKYDAGIDIQSPNAMIGMHIKTPSIPLFVEGGNIFLHPNNDSYVSLRGIVGNWRNISVKASLNNNDDNVMFINRDNIEVTLPPDVPGHTIYFKRMSGGVRLTGGRILPAPGGQEVSYIDLDFASGFIKCMGNYWVMFYCG